MQPTQPGARRTVSEALETWLRNDQPKTIGALVSFFGPKSFAVLFVVLLAVPALPLPTGGATHLFELIAMLLAAQLIVGRRTLWLPERWRRTELTGAKRERLLSGLLGLIRRLERISRPRLRLLFGGRASNSVFGVVVFSLSLGAFLAPPFSALDTLPALGAVLVALGVLLEDFAIVLAGAAIGSGGVALEIALGKAALSAVFGVVSMCLPDVRVSCARG